MSDYTMPTGRVRHAATEPHGERITGPEFDAWLATVQAAAWAEGREVGYTEGFLDADDRIEHFTTNPYEQEET